MPTYQGVPLPTMSPADLLLGLTLLSPVLIVILTAIVVLLIDLVVTDWVSRRPLMWISCLGLLGALGACIFLLLGGYAGKNAFGGFLVADSFALFFEMLFCLAAILVILSATTFVDREELFEAEFYIMVLFSTSGLMLMASGNELMTIYLALEVTSLSLSFLATWNKRDTIAGQGLKSTEAGIKFFLLSAMSTAILLYGMALLYGATGATTLADISHVITGTPTPAALLSITMLVAGLGFKIAAAPFQLWTPDVYQGAATPATAFFSVGSKAAGFAVLLRIFNGALPGISGEWTVLFGVLAFVTITLGNLIAIVQTNIKRLMAYSSITHVGYMLIGLAAFSVEGTSAVMFYLVAYTFTNLGAFIVITIMANYVPRRRDPWLWRPRGALARAGWRSDGRVTVTRWHPAIRRLLCQAVPVPGGHPRRQPRAAAARAVGGAHVGCVAVLLRPCDPRHVDARTSRSRGGQTRELQSGPGAGCQPGGRACLRHPGRAAAERRDGQFLGQLLPLAPGTDAKRAREFRPQACPRVLRVRERVLTRDGRLDTLRAARRPLPVP